MSNTPISISASIDSVWDKSCWLSIHTSYFIDEESRVSSCNKWGTCYSTSSSSQAKEPKRILIDEGSEACYKWLEDNFSELVKENKDG